MSPESPSAWWWVKTTKKKGENSILSELSLSHLRAAVGQRCSWTRWMSLVFENWRLRGVAFLDVKATPPQVRTCPLSPGDALEEARIVSGSVLCPKSRNKTPRIIHHTHTFMHYGCHTIDSPSSSSCRFLGKGTNSHLTFTVRRDFSASALHTFS